DNGDDTYTCTVNTEAVFTNGDVTYTAQTAPIIYQNGINGYSEGAPASVAGARKGGPGTNEDNLLAGYIFVGVGCRGKDSEVDGTAPACIVDLKAGVRYLKASKDVLPGDTNKIFAAGSSAGGSVTALLAASGNSSLYDSYLEEIGAIMDETDDICGALVFCPIADLGIGAAAFEYLHDGETTMKVGWGDVEPTDMTEFQATMHEALVDSYKEYLGTLGMDADEYQAAFLEQINTSITNYVDLYVEDTDAFAEENPALTYEDGTFSVADITTFVSTYMSRSKTVPAFDTLDKSSNEAGLFDGEHFSENVLSILESLADEYEEAAEAVDEYAAEITEERLLEVKLMSASTFLTGEEESTIAPYWRFRNGTLDGDLGSIAAFTMKKILDANGYDTDYDLIWGYGHTMADYAFEDIQTYIDAICAE
ncbi:MAG: hypothetical protein LUF30_01755, partial [Lachnospiraceae bacterium]|nr:hypothetical protein [Lachnospiraceae bacterium]